MTLSLSIRKCIYFSLSFLAHLYQGCQKVQRRAVNSSLLFQHVLFDSQQVYAPPTTLQLQSTLGVPKLARWCPITQTQSDKRRKRTQNVDAIKLRKHLQGLPCSRPLSLSPSIIKISPPPKGNFELIAQRYLQQVSWWGCTLSLSKRCLQQNSLHTCLSITEINTSLAGTVINGVTGDN